MSSLQPEDLRWCVSRLPDRVRLLLKSDRMFVAGGFIRSCITGDLVADIDVFGGSKDASKAAAMLFGDPFTTQFAYTAREGGVPVQFIHKWEFTSAARCIDCFDFTIARAAIYYDDGWQSLCDDAFYSDLAAKRLVYTGNGEPGGSLLRLLKFTKRGYRIAPESLAALVSKLMDAVRPSSMSQLQALTALIREVDPLTLETP